MRMDMMILMIGMILFKWIAKHAKRFKTKLIFNEYLQSNNNKNDNIENFNDQRRMVK